MAEAQVGAGETSIAGLHLFDTDFALFIQHMAGKDLFGQCHRRWVIRARLPNHLQLGFLLDRREKNLPLHARYIEWKQPAVLDHLTRNLIFPDREFAQGNFFAAANAVD